VSVKPMTAEDSPGFELTLHHDDPQAGLTQPVGTVESGQTATEDHGIRAGALGGLSWVGGKVHGKRFAERLPRTAVRRKHGFGSQRRKIRSGRWRCPRLEVHR